MQYGQAMYNNRAMLEEWQPARTQAPFRCMRPVQKIELQLAQQVELHPTATVYVPPCLDDSTLRMPTQVMLYGSLSLSQSVGATPFNQQPCRASRLCYTWSWFLGI